MDLKCAHSLFAGEHQEDNGEPFAQGIVRVLKYGARDDAEAIAILAASQDFAGLLVHAFLAALAEVMKRPRLERVSLAAASWADRAIGPPLPLQERLAGLVIGEPFQQFAQRHRFLIHDENNSRNKGRCQTPDNPH